MKRMVGAVDRLTKGMDDPKKKENETEKGKKGGVRRGRNAPAFFFAQKKGEAADLSFVFGPARVEKKAAFGAADAVDKVADECLRGRGGVTTFRHIARMRTCSRVSTEKRSSPCVRRRGDSHRGFGPFCVNLRLTWFELDKAESTCVNLLSGYTVIRLGKLPGWCIERVS
jgi:hypothetical protein